MSFLSGREKNKDKSLSEIIQKGKKKKEAWVRDTSYMSLCGVVFTIGLKYDFDQNVELNLMEMLKYYNCWRELKKNHKNTIKIIEIF